MATADGNADENRRTVLTTGYQELCKRYQGIDDFRMKLLGLLPLTTSGIFLLTSSSTTSSSLKAASLPIGLFGFIATLGLFFYELRGMQYCIALIQAGKDIEDELHIKGTFKCRPRPVAGFIGIRAAASVIYPIVLAAWMYIAFANILIAGGIFIGGIAVFLLFDLEGHRALDFGCKYCRKDDSEKHFKADKDEELSKQVQKHFKECHQKELSDEVVQRMVEEGAYQEWDKILYKRKRQLKGLLNWVLSHLGRN